jgi:hypothetical protein
MMQCDTMPDMETLMDRQRLVGWIVRDAIINSGRSYSDVARRWPISLPTLNRLMNSGNVGLRFLAQAEKNLGFPDGLLSMVIDGDIEGIRHAIGPPDFPGLTDKIRAYILTELGGARQARTRKSS